MNLKEHFIKNLTGRLFGAPPNRNKQCRHWADKECWNIQVTKLLGELCKRPFTLSTREVCLNFGGYDSE